MTRNLASSLTPRTRKNVIGDDRPLHQRFTGLDIIALVHDDMFGFGNQVLLGLTVFRSDDNPPLALEILAEADPAVNSGDDRLILWFADLKQFSHPGQTTGNILGLGGLPGNLADNRTRRITSPSLTEMIEPTGRV